MEILITGTKGYVGAALYNAFKDKHEVTCLTRDDFDLTDTWKMLSFFQDKHFDVVLHCASKGGSRLEEDSWDVLNINLGMYYNLLGFRKYYDRLITFGSGAGMYPKDKPYSLSKSVISKSVDTIDNFYELIIYNVFDENEKNTRFIKSNIKRYINKEFLHIYEHKKMTFFYMKDLVKLVEFAISAATLEKHIECSYSSSYSLVHVANIINSLSSYEVDILATPKLGEDYIASSYFPLPYIGLEEGIKEVYEKLK